MENKTKLATYIPQSSSDNRIHYRRFVNALRVGITNVYYREDEKQREILKIYDDYIFRYVHAIHFFLIHELQRFTIKKGRDMMYQNHLTVIILFFMVDFEIGSRSISQIDFPNSIVGNFVHQLFLKGFQSDLHGISPFECNLMEIIQNMGLHEIYRFDRLRLLKNPRISILYQKFPSKPEISSEIQESESEKKPTVIVPRTSEEVQRENQELKMVVQGALLEIQRMQLEQITITRERDLLRQSVLELFEENAKLKKRISEMENQKIAESISSPQSLLDGWDMNILGLSLH